MNNRSGANIQRAHAFVINPAYTALVKFSGLGLATPREAGAGRAISLFRGAMRRRGTLDFGASR